MDDSESWRSEERRVEVVVQNALAPLMFGDHISEQGHMMTTWSGQDSNCSKVIIRSQIIPCFLWLITASTDLDLINPSASPPTPVSRHLHPLPPHGQRTDRRLDTRTDKQTHKYYVLTFVRPRRDRTHEELGRNPTWVTDVTSIPIINLIN